MHDGISGFEIRNGLIKSEAALCSPLISNAIDLASKGKAMNDQRIMNDWSVFYSEPLIMEIYPADLSHKSSSIKYFRNPSYFFDLGPRRYEWTSFSET